MTKVVIVGGGIAGLATAHYLQKLGKTRQVPLSYTLLEEREQLGGVIQTRRRDGLTIEGGPDSYLTQKPWGLRLCRELGLEDRLIPAQSRPVYVVHRGRLLRVPHGFRLTVPTDIGAFLLSPLFSPWGKLRVMCEPFIPVRREPGDESVAAFVGRRVGREALERLAGPIMSGIYTSSPERLSMLSTFPMFPELERRYGSLMRGMLAMRRKMKGRPAGGDFGSMFASLHGGMSEMIDRLVAGLDGDLRSACAASTLRRTASGFEIATASGDTLAADIVVLACPAHASARLVAACQPELAARLDRIAYVGTATVSLAYDRQPFARDCAPNGLGFLVPAREDRELLACTWSSSKFTGRAPEDRVLIRAFLGGERAEDLLALDDEALASLARAKLERFMGLRCAPLLQEVFRWPKANPQYDVGHLDRMAELERAADRIPGLYLTGSAYRGIGIPGCIGDAVRTQERVAAALGIEPVDRCDSPPPTARS